MRCDQRPLANRSSACLAAQNDDVPAAAARIAAAVERQRLLGDGLVEDDGFLRQPFQRGAGGNLQHDILARDGAAGLVPLARARCGQQRVRTARPR